MRLRTTQIACLLLLLTSMGAAQASTRNAEFSLGGNYISMLLAQKPAVARAETSLSRQLDQPAAATPVASIAVVDSAWTMRPPSAHSVRVQAVTSGI